jgi:hypothetical protein
LTDEIRFSALLQGFTVAVDEKAGKSYGHMDTGLAKEVLRSPAGTKEGAVAAPQSERSAQKKKGAPESALQKLFARPIWLASLFET